MSTDTAASSNSIPDTTELVAALDVRMPQGFAQYHVLLRREPGGALRVRRADGAERTIAADEPHRVLTADEAVVFDFDRWRTHHHDKAEQARADAETARCREALEAALRRAYAVPYDHRGAGTHEARTRERAAAGLVEDGTARRVGGWLVLAVPDAESGFLPACEDERVLCCGYPRFADGPRPVLGWLHGAPFVIVSREVLLLGNEGRWTRPGLEPPGLWVERTARELGVNVRNPVR